MRANILRWSFWGLGGSATAWIMTRWPWISSKVHFEPYNCALAEGRWIFCRSSSSTEMERGAKFKCAAALLRAEGPVSLTYREIGASYNAWTFGTAERIGPGSQESVSTAYVSRYWRLELEGW